jgi:tRNA threonylcarbamoyladenosine biosynthesis protein TsaB
VSARGIAIDTASTVGSLALIEGGELVEELRLQSADGYSPVVFDALRELLERRQWALESVDFFAGASGPGSFTGVRVCLAAVKGLADTLGKPAFAISNLQAAALLGEGELRAVWLDARRGEIYGAVYSSQLDLVGEETVGKRDAWVESLPGGSIILAADGLPLAGAIARIAAGRFGAGERPDAAGIDANYVRRSDAELAWRDR